MRTLVTICLLIGFQFTRGQSTKPSITGKVMDSLSGTELAFATASIYRAKDTSLIAFKLSNLSGSFKVAGLPLNINLRVIITYSGYREFRKEFMLTNNKLEYDLGTIILSRDIRSLDEILVIAERPPIVVRKDTIEFNANSFKTLPSALLEDLLKKLPGVELGRDGNITVNGKHVNRILVDGKDFFAGDISIATRNLPANIIDKIQVVNDGEEVERNPDAPEGSIGKVINVKLKKSIKKGWFGKIYAGKGTGGRYELGGIVNSFADTLQVSVLGFGNNINKAGFGLGDLQSIGGFSRSGMRAAKMIDNGVQVNGVSLGGIGQGIQKSNGAGVNLNHDIGKKLTLNVQYFYGQLKSTVNESNFLEQRFANSFLITESLQSNLINDKIHKLSSTFKWKPTPTINITYRPSFSWQKNVLAVHRTANSGNNLYPLLNNLVNTLSIQDINKSINQEIVVNKNFRKRGRSLMVGFNFTSNNTESDAYNKSETIFFDVTPSYTDTIDQLRSRDNEKTVYNLSMNYAEPISKKIIVRISNLFETSNYIDGILTLKKPDPSGSYTMIDTAFSNKLGRNGWKNIMSTTVSFNTGAIKISPGIGYTFLHFNNRLGKSDFLKQNYSYIIPRIAITWKQLTISYQSTVIEPSGNDLIPVPDNNNPLLFRFGNINLTPAHLK